MRCGRNHVARVEGTPFGGFKEAVAKVLMDGGTDP